MDTADGKGDDCERSKYGFCFHIHDGVRWDDGVTAEGCKAERPTPSDPAGGSLSSSCRDSSGENEVGSTLRRLAFLADRTACFELLDTIGRERNRAIPDQVHGNLADAIGRIDRQLVERFD